MNFLITPHSVDSTLVGSHCCTTVSRLTPALDGLNSEELEFPAPSIVYSGGKHWSNVSVRRGACSSQSCGKLHMVVTLISQKSNRIVVWRLMDVAAGALIKDHCSMAAPTKGPIKHQGQTENFNYHGARVAIGEPHGFWRQLSLQKWKIPNFDLKLSRTLSFMGGISLVVQASFETEPANLLAATLQNH